MSADLQSAHDAALGQVEPSGAAATGRSVPRTLPTSISPDSRLAVEIRGLVESHALDEARDRFGELVAMHQRRALRIAYQYLRDSFDADEAVQDAFVKAFTH